MKNTFLPFLLCMLFSMSCTAQDNHLKHLQDSRKNYEESIPPAAKKEMEKLLKLEEAKKGGENIGSALVEDFKACRSNSAKELELFKKTFNNFTLPHNNMKNNLGLIRRYIDVLDMAYEMSGDIWFLDKMVECCDHMIDGQNGPGKYLCVNKEYEYYWPTGFAYREGEVYANLALFTNGVIVGRLARTAKQIIRHEELYNKKTNVKDKFDLGNTYLERAKTYIDRSERTMDFLVKLCYRPGSGLMVYPPEYQWSSRPDFVEVAPAWNRYFMQGIGFQHLAEAMEMLSIKPDKIALYDKINQKMVDDFFSTIKNKEANGKVIYWWPYNYYFKPDRVEDAHAWFDVDCLTQFYKSNRYGITKAMMEPFANTYMEVMYKGDGRTSRNVDGSGKVALNHGGIAWLSMAEFRPQIYDILSAHITENKKIEGKVLGEFIYYKSLMKEWYPNRTPEIMLDIPKLKEIYKKKKQ